jgi:hypothetical protein
MNHLTQSFLSSAIVSAVLWLACAVNAAHADVTPANGNAPPNNDKSKTTGALIQKGETNMQGWRNTLTGDLANYNSYTKKKSESDQVLDILKNCKDSTGKKSYGCDFAQANSGAEVNASALMGALGYADDASRAAAFNFIVQMTNAAPYPYPGDDKVFKDPKNKAKGLTDDGISYYSTILKQLPTLTVPQNVLLSIFADRERQPGLGGSTPAGDGKGNASLLEMMNYEANRRYADSAWFSAMNSSTTTDAAVHREIAFMLAFQNYMMVKEYEQNQRTELLLVAMISAINNMSNSVAAQTNPEAQKNQKKKMDQQSN